MIIAVDFDNTIAKTDFPTIIEPNNNLVVLLKKRKERGDKLILWTCREGILLKQAIDYCENKLGLTFDAINDNTKEMIEKYNGNSRKVYADLYIDDHSIIPEFCEF